MRNLIRVASIAGVAIAALFNCQLATAQPYPSKPIRIIVPTSPGGIIDIVARMVGQKLTEVTGQIVVIENRAGASNNIGTEYVARAPADGYTLLAATLPLVVNPGLFEKLPFNVERDFAPVSLVVSAPYVLVAHPSLPAKSVKELVALAKAKPGALSYSTGGSGTNLHIAAELFALQAGIKLLHIPYKGGGPALGSVIAGEAALSFPSLGAVLPQVNAGRLRAIGITSTQRSPLLPQVPTIAEAGYPDYAFNSWVGLLAPAGTPANIVAALNTQIVKAMRNPAVIERLAADGNEVVAGSPEQFAALIKTELVRWAKVVKASGMKPE
jgi:tripartite-type tricarboxylate transporter receptor subunit TctC